MHHLGKVATGQLVREFESLILRKYKNGPVLYRTIFVLGGVESKLLCSCVRFERRNHVSLPEETDEAVPRQNFLTEKVLVAGE